MSTTRSRAALASLFALAALTAALGLLAGPGHSAQKKPKAGKNCVDGTWTAVAMPRGGKALPEEQVKRLRMTIEGEKVTVSLLRKTIAGTVKVDNTSEPKQLDLHLKGERTSSGIYRLENDTLTFYFAE